MIISRGGAKGVLLQLLVAWLIVGATSCSPISAPEKRADDSFPAKLVKFTPVAAEPVFVGGGKGAWDEAIRERGWIMRDNNEWKMWYTGYNPDPERPKMMKLGYATSPDGIRWTRHPRNPIHSDHWVEDMMIVTQDGKYWMFAEGEGDQAHLLSSDNGIDWKRVGPLDVRMANGEPIKPGPYGTPTAWYDESGDWYLFYERSDLGIWLAKSKDMKVWTNVQDEPVIGVGPGEFEKDLVALNQIIKHDGRYYAYYHGSAKSGPAKGLWSTCVASSPDLIHWTKFPGNPLLPMEQNKSSGILIADSSNFRLYTMHKQVFAHQN